MPTKKHKSEQVVTVLRQLEVEVAHGKTTPQARFEGKEERR
jgi:hypothetical protein